MLDRWSCAGRAAGRGHSPYFARLYDYTQLGCALTRRMRKKAMQYAAACQRFAPAGATKGLSGRPLETFGPHTVGEVCTFRTAVLRCRRRYRIEIAGRSANSIPHSAFRIPHSSFRMSPHFILNCTFAAPACAWVMAHAMASAASSGLGVSSMCKSSFTICCICFLSALP